jgi:GTPase
LLIVDHFLEVRIATFGCNQAGKSTLLGVITQGEEDNGKGRSRLRLLRHRHEILSGRTSSIAHEIIGFTPLGKLINYASTNVTTWYEKGKINSFREQICDSSSKIVTFLDLPGFSKYERTTLGAFTGRQPDYAAMCISGTSCSISALSVRSLSFLTLLDSAFENCSWFKTANYCYYYKT